MSGVSTLALKAGEPRGVGGREGYREAAVRPLADGATCCAAVRKRNCHPVISGTIEECLDCGCRKTANAIPLDACDRMTSILLIFRANRRDADVTSLRQQFWTWGSSGPRMKSFAHPEFFTIPEIVAARQRTKGHPTIIPDLIPTTERAGAAPLAAATRKIPNSLEGRLFRHSGCSAMRVAVRQKSSTSPRIG